MSKPLEILLATLPGETERERISVVLRRCPRRGERVLLHRQTWGEGIGWYDQSTLDLSPDQVQHLRNALGVAIPAVSRSAAEFNPETGGYRFPRSA